MKLFQKKKDNQYIIIVGCGRLGANLANTLSDSEKSVLIIDKDKSSFRKLSPSFSGIILTGDATEVSVLREAEIEKATAVVTVTNRDNTNIMVAQMAKELFHIEQVVARLYDPDREHVYREFEIDTICPAVLATKEIDQLLGVLDE